MDKKDELVRNLEQLSAAELRDIRNLARSKLYAQINGLQPPTVESWSQFPEWLRWMLFLRVVWAVWQIRFAEWMWKLIRPRGLD